MATEKEAKATLTAMFGCFPQQADSVSVETRMRAYWQALSDLSPDEIVNVCRAAMRGEIGKPGFLPSTGEIYQAARPRPPTLPKKSPEWRPHQDRFLSADGTLYIKEGGFTTVYTSQELREWGYALPKPPDVLNRPELEARGLKSLHRLPAPDEAPIQDPAVRELVLSSLKSMAD